jgi:branched-chain amino acid transport system permease protein
LPLPVVDVFGLNIVLFGLSLVTLFGLYLAISVSLNLEYGYGGIPNFGEMLYIAAGASIGGTFAGRFAAWLLNMNSILNEFIGPSNFQFTAQINAALANQPLDAALIFVLTIVVAAVTGGLIGLATTVVVRRLRSDYFAMALFSLAQVYTIILNDYPPIIGGPFGISLPNVYQFAGEYNEVVAAASMVIFGVLVFVLFEKTVRSPFGRALRAVRDNETASESLGKNSTSMKRTSYIFASMIAGIAGALYSFYTGDVYSQTFLYTTWTVTPFLMIVLGGTSNNFGVSLGVLAYLLIQQITDIGQFSFQGFLPFSVTWLQYFLISGILLTVLYLRPQGLIPEKATHTLGRKSLQKLFARINPKEEGSR